MAKPTLTEQRVQKLEQLARSEFPDLDQYYTEVLLIEAAVRAPDEIACATDGDDDAVDTLPSRDHQNHEHEVRADLIRWLCVNREATALINPSGIGLSRALITGSLNLNYVDVPFPILLDHCQLTDPVSMVGVQIPDFALSGSRTGDIYANGARVKSSMALDSGFRAEGTVSLTGAQIGGDLVCDGGTFVKRGGVAIIADGINVGGNVSFRAAKQSGELEATPFRAQGAVRLHSARIAGDLDCTGGEFINPDSTEEANRGRAIHLGPAIVEGTIFFRPGYGTQRHLKPEFKSDGIIDLRGASAGNLWDEEGSWPKRGQILLDGFVYKRFRMADPADPVPSPCPADGKIRLKWLGLDETPHITQPYRQLAEVLLTAGDSCGAKLVLEAMEEKLSKRNGRGLTYWLKRWIGFGYRPERAVWGLLFLWLAGSLVFSYAKQQGGIVPTDKDAAESFRSTRKVPNYYPQFTAPIFSLENTFPLVKLGQAEKWQANPEGGFTVLRWVIWAQNLAGWVLATLFLAALSGVVQHN